MTREIKYFLENDIRTHPLIFRTGIQHKGNKQTKQGDSQQTLAVFSAGLDSENKII